MKIYAVKHFPCDMWEPTTISDYFLNKEDADLEAKELNRSLEEEDMLSHGSYEVEELEVLEKREGEIK